LRIHAICLALNEEPFIVELLNCLYPFCSGISVLSQYDRDWYGQFVEPDETVSRVLSYPDPAGKIHLVVRRWKDQAAAMNHEILSVKDRCARGILTHGVPKQEVIDFHRAPDYFWVVDADEIYDLSSVERIIDYLGRKRPRGMRVLGYNYVRTWNRRVPTETIRFEQFGFIRPDVLFESIRTVTWNESRLSKLLSMLHLPDWSASVFGFISCPAEVGVFHHGCWIGDDKRLKKKMCVSAHRMEAWRTPDWDPAMLRWVDQLSTVFVPRGELPKNIREGEWPAHFFD
jgi:hypothetical protein